MATEFFDGVEACITELRARRAVLGRDIADLDRDIADLEAAQHQVAAIAARYGLAQASPTAPPAQLPRRGSPIPRIPPGTPRLSAARITALAVEVRGLTPRAALEHVGEQEGEVQAADAQKVLAAAGLSAASSSYAHKLLSHSARFEKVGAGRFRWRAADTAPPESAGTAHA